MKRLIEITIVATAIVTITACSDSTPSSPSATGSVVAPNVGNGLLSGPLGKSQTGNGAPSGPHYNLNLLGMTQDKTADITSGNRIFIYFEGRTKILLREGVYAVLDGNGTDGEASFQPPNPDNGSGDFAYSVWIRPVAGKGDVSFQSCFTDSTGTWCYAGSLVQNLSKTNKLI